MRRREAWCVLIAALLLRLGLVWWQGPPGPPKGDALEYHTYAVRLSDSFRYEGPLGERAGRMPGYPLLLSAVYSFAGPSPRAALWVQCLLGALTCLLLYILASRLLKPPWALVCGLAAAASYDLTAPSGALLTECLYNLLLASSLTLLLAASWKRDLRALSVGICLGLAYLVRPEILPYALGLLLLCGAAVGGWRRKHSVIALLGLFLVCAPWVVRNGIVLRRFVPATTTGGLNLYLGLRLPLEKLAPDGTPRYQPPEGTPETERGRLYTEEFGRLWRRTGLLLKLKAYAFDFLSALYPFLPAFDATYAFLVPFWLLGLFASLRRREFRPVTAFVVFSLAVYSFVGGPVSRYRQSFSPCLVLLAALGAQEMWAKAPSRFRVWTGCWALLNVLLWVFGRDFRRLALWFRDLV